MSEQAWSNQMSRFGNAFPSDVRPETQTGPFEEVDNRWLNGWKWISEHLDSFLPSDFSCPEEIKAAAELALLYGRTVRWSGLKMNPCISEVGAFLSKLLADPEVSQHARRQPAHYNPYIVAYLALRSSGYRIKGHEEAIKFARRAGYPGITETVAFRRLELKYVLDPTGQKESLWLKAPYRATTLGHARNPVYLLDWEVYSITHTLFYLTDFSGPAPKMPPEEHKRIAELVEMLLVHYWREANWDIVGELLVNLTALGQFRTALFKDSMKALLMAWRSDGALPGPSFRPSSEPIADGYIFQHCYHTTLVGLLFCGAFLYRTKITGEDGRSDER